MPLGNECTFIKEQVSISSIVQHVVDQLIAIGFNKESILTTWIEPSKEFKSHLENLPSAIINITQSSLPQITTGQQYNIGWNTVVLSIEFYHRQDRIYDMIEDILSKFNFYMNEGEFPCGYEFIFRTFDFSFVDQDILRCRTTAVVSAT